MSRAGAAASARARSAVRVRGTVQGVGFRPHVYRLARELGLGGYVLNDASGVLLEVEGEEASIDAFLPRLVAEAPPLAVIEAVHVQQLDAVGDHGFAIVASPRGSDPDAPVAVDTAVCAECLRELFDPSDRRFRYPFINCTNCGPRFTIVRGIPYDRPFTTMARFRMCGACTSEYEEPADRRFHAQPNACPECGPRLTLLDAQGSRVPLGDAEDTVQAAARALNRGLIVAVKGVGGYHLAARADHEQAVAELRARKHREHKPFALMAPDLESALELIVAEAEEQALLESIQRPIVLARRRRDARVASAVAPRAPELGVMLPYSPLHHLLLHDVRVPLVMTSGNVSDEPIAYRDDDAIERLAPIADVLLVHDRPIQTRTDDSVGRVVSTGAERRSTILRRSRGYVPASLELPGGTAKPLLACGAEQKNTFCVAKDTRAWVGHHIGDLEHIPAHGAYREGIVHFERLFAVSPELVAHDLHPGYLSTSYALEREDVELIGVQHHHAHLAACLAEHRVEGPALGLIFDGTGYGTDGTVWGGELLIGDLIGFERVGWLRPAVLPGGTAAIREPWRMAWKWLAEAYGEPQPMPATLAGAVKQQAWDAMPAVAKMTEVSPTTTSIGRLFDAIGALCGLCARVSYEGQAAVELEAAASSSTAPRGYEVELTRDRAGALVLDPRAAVRAIAEDLCAGAAVPDVAAGFHAALAAAGVAAAVRIASNRGLGTVVLSGGVFQNRILVESLAGQLIASGLEVLIPQQLPPNDGGISFGQAVIAAARCRA